MEPKIKTLPNPFAQAPLITFTPDYSVICSEGHAPFSGEVEIQYVPKDLLLEFESLEDYLFAISLQSYTVESLAYELFNLLQDTLAPVNLSVTVQAHTIKHGPASCTFQH